MNDFIASQSVSDNSEIHLGIRRDMSKVNSFDNIYSNDKISYNNWHPAEPHDHANNKRDVGAMRILRSNPTWNTKWFDIIDNGGRAWRNVINLCMRKVEGLYFRWFSIYMFLPKCF